MYAELKIVVYTCDYCKHSIRIETQTGIAPPGWKKVASYGWGATNYTKYLDCCPACFSNGVHLKEWP